MGEMIVNPKAVEQLNSKFTIAVKEFTPQTVAAGAYTTYSDDNIKNKPIVGYFIGGVASGNVSITALRCNSGGMNLILKNNGSSAITPNYVGISYLDI